MPEPRHFSAFPPSDPFPESQRSTSGNPALPDFPGAAGERELGKFRPSKTPRLDAIAVVNDDGTEIGAPGVATEQVMLLRGILFGLSVMVDIPVDDLLSAGNSA